MPTTVNGVTSKSVVANTSTDPTLEKMLTLLERFSSDIEKALRFTNNSEKDKELLLEQLEQVNQQREELAILQKSEMRLQQNLQFLTKEQQSAEQKKFLGELIGSLDTISSLSNDLDSLALTMSGKLGVGKDFQETLGDLKSFVKSTEKSQKIQERRLELRDSAIDAGFSLFDNISEGFLSALGPFQELGLGLYRKLNLSDKIKSKVKTPTEKDLLIHGGDLGKASVYLGRLIDSQGDGDMPSLLESLFGEGGAFFSALVSNTILGKVVSAFGTSFLKALGVTSLSTLVAYTAFATFTDQMGKVYRDAQADAEEMTLADIDTNNSGTVTATELDKAINTLIAENRTISSWFDLWETEEDRFKARQQLGQILWNKLPTEVQDKSGMALDWLNTSAGVLPWDPTSVPSPIPSGGSLPTATFTPTAQINSPDGASVVSYTDGLGISHQLYVPAGQDPNLWVANYLDNQTKFASDLAKTLPKTGYESVSNQELDRLLGQVRSNSGTLSDAEIKNILTEKAVRDRNEAFQLASLKSFIDNSLPLKDPETQTKIIETMQEAELIDPETQKQLINYLSEISKNTANPTVVSQQGGVTTNDFSSLRL